MPTTQQRIEALAANVRETPKGHAITLDLYIYPSGASAIRAKGKTGLGHSLMCNDDDDMASVIMSIVSQIRATTK